MKSFIDEIIEYLDGKFANDDELTKKPKGHYAYDYGFQPSTEPYYEIQALNEEDTDEEFTRLVTATVDLQINVYGVKTRFNNKAVTAQEHTFILADKVDTYLQEYKYTSNRVTSMRKMTKTPPIPFDDGSKAYTSAIRYRCEIKN